MHGRSPYERPRFTRSGRAATQPHENLSPLADPERKLDCEVFIEELTAELTAEKEKHAQAITELAESRRRIRELDEALVAGEKEVATLKHRQERVIRDHKRYITFRRTAESEIEKGRQSIARLSQTTSELHSNNTTLENKSKQQALHIERLHNETETQRAHITELTGAIMQSSTIATPSRDDDYFAGEFARLTGAIRQWVLRYFDPLGAPVLRYRDLPAILADSLARTTLAYSSIIRSYTKIKLGRKEIEAGIAHRLTEHIFNHSFVFTMSAWPPISPAEFPAVSDLEMQKWRSQTAAMLSQRTGFDARFANAVSSVTEELGTYFVRYAKPGVEVSRVKVLRAIVEQAARLEVEISRELSVFQMPYIKPGSRYEMEHLDDRSGNVDESEDGSDSEEEEDDDDEDDEDDDSEDEENGEKGVHRRREFIVETVLFPPVVRLEYDDQGKIATTPIIVRKGVVTALRLKGGDVPAFL